MSHPNVAIIIYTVHGHVDELAKAILEGIVEAGGTATIHQIPGTKKTSYETINPQDLVKFDAFLFGIPSYFGNFPNKWKSFWDSTAGLWQERALLGKFAGVFVSTGTPGGGQETTIINSISALTHHGIIYVPLGYYGTTLGIFSEMKEIHGGSPWGAGAFAGPKDDRVVSEVEKDIARQQGISFWKIVSKYKS